MRKRIQALALILLMMRPASAGMLSDALEWFGIEDAKTAYDAGDYATAMRRYRVLADKGDQSAMWHIGVMHRMGLGVAKNAAEAFRWFRMAGGFSVAEYDIATMYEEGEGVQKNKFLAIHWYCVAMLHGYLDAVGDLNRLMPGKDLDEICVK